MKKNSTEQKRKRPLCHTERPHCVSRDRSRVGIKGYNDVTRQQRPNAIERRDLNVQIQVLNAPVQ